MECPILAKSSIPTKSFWKNLAALTEIFLLTGSGSPTLAFLTISVDSVVEIKLLF